MVNNTNAKTEAHGGKTSGDNGRQVGEFQQGNRDPRNAQGRDRGRQVGE